jgi:HEAT repeat protein/beta-lactamase regulating signal transducer with metallopeptidase domain
VSAAGLVQLIAGLGAGWALGSLLKGTLLLVAVFLIAAALRRASASLRHLLWSGGIAAVLLLPLVSLMLPWRLPVIRVPAAALAPPAAVPLATGTGAVAPSPAAPAPGLALTPGRSSAPASPGLTLPNLTAAEWFEWMWLAGALVVLLRLGRGAWLVRRVLHRATPLASPDWTVPLVEAADRLGLAREPLLVASDAVLMPIVCGVWRPAIVLPADAREWTERRRRAVLCHELAHVRRFDLGLTILSRIGCAIWWFHPLVWVAARRLRLESERACDDMVLGVGTRPSEYADHLLQIACGAGSMRSPAAALPMAERREFEGRMLAILEKDARRAPASRRHAALLAALGLAVLLPLAAMGMARAPQAGADTGAVSGRPISGSVPDATPASRSGTPVARTRQQTREQVHTEQHQMTAVARRAVVAALQDAEPAARAAAARTLGQPEDTAAVGALERLLRTDANADVRLAAAEALGRMEAKRSVPVLEAALGDQSAAVRRTVAWALGQIEDKSSVEALVHALADSDAEVRETAIWALGQIADSGSVAALAERLGRDGQVEVRRKSAWALGQIEDKSAVPALGTALHRDSDPEVRRTAAWALGQIGDAASVQALADALGDADEQVRTVSVWALGQIGPRHAPDALLRATGHDTPGVRAKAAWALGQIGDEAAVPALAAALADSVADVRRTALWALGQLDSDAARTAIIGALKSPDPDMRAAAVRALGGGRPDPRPEPMPMPRPRPTPDEHE